jgi:addiction module HigA family antidote
VKIASGSQLIVHPGTLLRDLVLPALQLSVSQAARELHVSRQTLHRILSGQSAITADMAVRLERLCGIGAKFWLQRQASYDVARLDAANGLLLSRIPSRALPKSVVKRIGAVDGA